MKTFLAIETSTSNGSVALLADGKLVFSELFEAGRSSALLFEVLERALAASPTAPDHLVIGLGPGSYAGVRIAISAATGLSLATGAPMIGIPSSATLEEGEYLAVGDARRETYYFTHVRDGACLVGPELLTAEDFAKRISMSNLPIYASESVLAAPDAGLRFPSAERLAFLAARGEGITGNLEPIYLREPHITPAKSQVKKTS